MAYMSQERKAKIAAVVKPICKRHGVKATLSVYSGATLVLTIAEGSIDFFADRVPPRHVPEHLAEYQAREWARAAEQGHLDVNVYHYRDHFSGAALAFLSEVIPAMNKGNHDNSDSMIDHFDVGWYVDVNIGRCNKPYRLLPAGAPARARKARRPFANYVESRETEENVAEARAAAQASRTITAPSVLFWQRPAEA